MQLPVPVHGDNYPMTWAEGMARDTDRDYVFYCIEDREAFNQDRYIFCIGDLIPDDLDSNHFVFENASVFYYDNGYVARNDFDSAEVVYNGQIMYNSKENDYLPALENVREEVGLYAILYAVVVWFIFVVFRDIFTVARSHSL